MSELGIGIIGLGMGRAHLDAFHQSRHAQVRAVCDVDEERLGQVAGAYRVPLATTDYREVVARPDVDAVCVASPDTFHREHSVAAMKAGKHVLCEKPLALTIEDCEAIVDVAAGSECVFMIAQVCRFAPGFVRAKQLVESGAIGELFLVQSEYAHDYTHVPGAANWRKHPLRHPVVGGGCHAIDLLRWIAGNAEEAAAFANHKVLVDWPIDDCTVGILRFPDGVVGQVMVSIGCRRSYTMRSCFYGTKGTIICDNTSPTMTLYTQDAAQLELPAYGLSHTAGIEIPVGSQAKPVAAEVGHFLKLIVEGGPNEMTAAEGARTVATCLALVESARAGTFVEVTDHF